MIIMFLIIVFITLITFVIIGVISGSRSNQLNKSIRVPKYDNTDCWSSDLPDDIKVYNSTVTKE